MRPAGSGSSETLRTPAGAATLRRPAGSTQGEALRAPTSALIEVRRASSSVTSEYLIDPYVRQHPPELGCTIYSIQGIAGVGAAGCMVAGLVLSYPLPE